METQLLHLEPDNTRKQNSVNNIEKSISKEEKGKTIEVCVSKANKYILENGMCLFIFDVQGSKKYIDRQELQTQLINIIKELNLEFDKYFPENNLATMSRQEKGFFNLLGDGSWAAINDSEVISMITKYLQDNYPNIQFYFDVARDGYDEAVNLVK